MTKATHRVQQEPKRRVVIKRSVPDDDARLVDLDPVGELCKAGDAYRKATGLSPREAAARLLKEIRGR